MAAAEEDIVFVNLYFLNEKMGKPSLRGDIHIDFFFMIETPPPLSLMGLKKQ